MVPINAAMTTMLIMIVWIVDKFCRGMDSDNHNAPCFSLAVFVLLSARRRQSSRHSGINSFKKTSVDLTSLGVSRLPIVFTGIPIAIELRNNVSIRRSPVSIAMLWLLMI